jgi:hypothetical protein
MLQIVRVWADLNKQWLTIEEYGYYVKLRRLEVPTLKWHFHHKYDHYDHLSGGQYNHGDLITGWMQVTFLKTS